MAGFQINRKFLATPGWGIQNVGGQTLTMTIDGVVSSGTQTYKKIYFGSTFERMSNLLAKFENGRTDLKTFLSSLALNDDNEIISSIPAADLADFPVYGGVSVDMPDNGLVDITPGIGADADSKVVAFLDFIDKHPAHVTRMNIRAATMEALPQNITIYTPNVFTGQYDKQIINVTADANMYQNQASIITVQVDAFFARNSIVEFGGQFANAGTAKRLYVDCTFDRYLSLEKALYENLQLLATPAGQVAAASEAVTEVNNQVATAVGTPFRGTVAQTYSADAASADEVRREIRRGARPTTNIALQSWTR